MTEESDLAPVAEPEIVTETEGQVPEGEKAETEGEEPEEQKSASKERREREKRRQAQLREDLQTARAQAAEAESRRQAILNAAKAEKEPKESEFPDPLEYVVAKAAWASEQKATNRQANEAEAETKEAQSRADELMAEERAMLDLHWDEQATEAKGRYKDFDEVVRKQGLFPLNSHLGPLVKMSDMAGDLAYHIASDRALHDELVRMSPVDAARHLGRIEATMSGPKPRTSTQAPMPISPVRGQAGATRTPESMSMDEYIAARKAGKIK